MSDFEVVFCDIGEGDSTLLRLPGNQYALIDVFRCEGHGIDLFRLLDDRLPQGESGKPHLALLTSPILMTITSMVWRTYSSVTRSGKCGRRAMKPISPLVSASRSSPT